MTKRKPNSTYRRGLDDVDRFNSKVDPAGNGCWLWKGKLNRGGYGRFVMFEKYWLAHRASYYLFVSRNLKDESKVMHTCDNPACVRPSHLKIGTQGENVRDMVEKGRGKGGAIRKLNPEMVLKLRNEFRFHSMEYGIRGLAKRYGIHPITVYDVIKFKTWRDTL